MTDNSVTSDEIILIALGANLPSAFGSPDDTLTRALERIGDSALRVQRVSRLFRTPCFPPGAGPDYVNAAAVLSGARDPGQILSLLHEVEAEFGRVRQQRWGSRVLDIDLLAVGGRVHPDRATYDTWRALPPEAQARAVPDRLILPHPRLQDRAFVLIPLMDVAPDWRHPVSGLTVREMADALPNADKEGVHPL